MGYTKVFNHPQPHTTIHNHPNITQKSQNVYVNSETDVDIDNDMK